MTLFRDEYGRTDIAGRRLYNGPHFPVVRSYLVFSSSVMPSGMSLLSPMPSSDSAEGAEPAVHASAPHASKGRIEVPVSS
jgi:hypothetical protein